MVNSCSNFSGFLIFNSICGSTGSALTTNLLKKLSEEYSKKSKLNFAIFPQAKLSNSIIEPYNAVIATSIMKEFSDAAFVLDNEAL